MHRGFGQQSVSVSFLLHRIRLLFNLSCTRTVVLSITSLARSHCVGSSTHDGGGRSPVVLEIDTVFILIDMSEFPSKKAEIVGPVATI